MVDNADDDGLNFSEEIDRWCMFVPSLLTFFGGLFMLVSFSKFKKVILDNIKKYLFNAYLSCTHIHSCRHLLLSS